MKKAICILIFLASNSLLLIGQSREASLRATYMQANTMLEEKQYDEAVRIYNRVLNSNPDFSPALLDRARAKYELEAYKGTKKDLIKYIENEGITDEVITLMASTEYNLYNYSQAKNYVELALRLNPTKTYLYNLAGNIEIELSHEDDACIYWTQAADRGSKEALLSLDVYCGGYTQSSPPNRNQKTDRTKPSNPNTRVSSEVEINPSDEEAIATSQLNRDRITEPEPNATMDVAEGPNMDSSKINTDNTIITDSKTQEIVIDEDLKIIVGEGLGSREVDDYPSIFMLSDVPGNVVINVCVDRSGKVISTELNEDKSTVLKQGLVSLALRKSKEIGFYPAFDKEQCGSLTFVISQ